MQLAPSRRSLLALGTPRIDPASSTRERIALTEGAWVDVCSGWVEGADALFDLLVEEVDWEQYSIELFGEARQQPRLNGGQPRPGTEAGDLVREMRLLLSEQYGVEFGVGSCNLYRDGRDSVAWHGDRVLRRLPQGLVAVVVLGDRRPFRLRPRRGGRSLGFDFGHGDLLVMGGSCQRTWQHSVPKAAHAGPRLSVTFRPTTQALAHAGLIVDPAA